MSVPVWKMRPRLNWIVSGNVSQRDLMEDDGSGSQKTSAIDVVSIVVGFYVWSERGFLS